MGTWEYRIMAVAEPDAAPEDGPHLVINDIYYDDNGKINGCGNLEKMRHGEVVGSYSVKGIRWSLRQMMKATTKPIIWYGEKFPEIYVPKQEPGDQDCQ